MKDSRFRLILYIIIFVILGTIGIQVYWNYKNYLINKQQFINDVQICLDNAVESYFANLAEENTLRFAFRELQPDSIQSYNNDSIRHSINYTKSFTEQPIQNESLHVEIVDNNVKYRTSNRDSILNIIGNLDSIAFRNSSKVLIKTLSSDSLSQEHFNKLTSKVIVSLTTDSLLLEEIDTLLTDELNRKKLNIDYFLTYRDIHNNVEQVNNFSGRNIIDDTINSSKLLNTYSKSVYLPGNTSLNIHFTNETKNILKRILTGIIVSTILVLLVIGCLFYLLKIIKYQKQLAEVKNDLIGNITHEFKTPIATIGVALESIKDFKVINDKEKTKQYLKISNNQLSKLNLMVEKLLETATLDSDSLQLNKEETNILALVESLVEKHKLQSQNKTISLKTSKENILAIVDKFHLENAINNVIDNAVKYGGDNITVEINSHEKYYDIIISDNGDSLTKMHRDKIFEQFYRVPKGNTHNVKGFGIGLYYTKKIIEKHGGNISLDLSNSLTTFKISLPNE